MNILKKLFDVIQDPRPAALLILLVAVVLFFIPRCSDNSIISVSSKGLADNIALNFSYTFEGNVLVTTPDGKVLQSVEPKKPGSGPLASITSISIAAVSEDNSKNIASHSSSGFLDKIIPSANATHYRGLNHIYYYNFSIDGVPDCIRYDISNYPPTYVSLGRTC